MSPSPHPAAPGTAVFLEQLASMAPDTDGRRWIFVPYDQLSDRLGPLAREAPESLGIVMVETLWKGRRRPYHKQKLALILANQRHFALEQARRGVAVDYRFDTRPYEAVLAEVIRDRGPLGMMEAAERELRLPLAELAADGHLEVLPHEGWLTTADDFEAGAGARPPWRQDAFYRHVRRDRGILMDTDGSPVGGRYSFDGDNRERWDGTPPAPEPPSFPDNPIKTEVLELVEEVFGGHPGRLRADTLPTTAEDARAAWEWARTHALPHFGPFEDAMSTRSRTLFHTRLSPLLNLHRVLAADVVAEVEKLEVDGEPVPLQSREGFIRQVLGWREFVRHVHRHTDGFRSIPWQDGSIPVVAEAGTTAGEETATDAGTTAGATTEWGTLPMKEQGHPSQLDRGAAPSHLGSGAPLPAAWWGTPSGMACLDEAVAGVMDDGWVHHIPRLMVLSNLATLLDVSPRELTDWFWVGFVDAFDWVVEPNVLAMGTFGTGPVMTTKPYVSGTPYIRKMGDFCEGCTLSPTTTCPISDLYWAFLERHRPVLEGNRRLALPLASAGKRSDEKKASDRAVFQAVSGALGGGGTVTPELVKKARARGGTSSDAH